MQEKFVFLRDAIEMLTWLNFHQKEPAFFTDARSTWLSNHCVLLDINKTSSNRNCIKGYAITLMETMEEINFTAHDEHGMIV